MTLRWQEEIELVKKEMASFLKFYADHILPSIENGIHDLKDLGIMAGCFVIIWSSMSRLSVSPLVVFSNIHVHIVLCFLAATLPCVDTDIEEGNEDVSDDPHAKVREWEKQYSVIYSYSLTSLSIA